MRFLKLVFLCSAICWLNMASLSVHAQETGNKVPEGMVLVPGGVFSMGTNEGDGGGGQITVRTYSDANPRHEVNVPAFYIDKTEVTNAQYKKYCDATKYPLPPHWKNGTYPENEAEFPVYNVNWWEATAYASWAGKRLPTEVEWEKAARGTDSRKFPWGDEWDNSRTTIDQKRPIAVGSRLDGASPYGALDMSDNVMEWVQDWYQAYPGARQKFPEYGTTHKVARGGAYATGEALFRTYYRCLAFPQARSEWIGFRCAKSVR